MKRTKWLSLALAGAILASALSGCANTPAETPADPPAAEEAAPAEAPAETEATAEEAAPADEEPLVIQWLAYNTYGQPDPDEPLIKYVEEHYNVKFDFWFVDDQKWDEVLSVRLASGDMPDMMRIKDSARIPAYVNQGVLAPISDEMMAMMPNYQAEVAKWDPTGYGFKDAYYEGELYLLKEANPGGAYPTVLVWRKDWLDKLGITKIPSTIDEFYEAAVKIVNEDPDGNGQKDTYAFSNTVISAIFGAYGAIPLKEFRGSGTQNLFYTMNGDELAFAATQPETKEALATLQKWYDEGLIDPEFVTGENKGGYWAASQDFENGRVAVTGMSMANHWQPPLRAQDDYGACLKTFMEINGYAAPAAEEATLEERQAAANEVFGKVIAIGPAITGPTGASGTHMWGAYGANGFAITTQAAADPRKVEFIAKLNEDMNADYDLWYAFTYGLEGTHYITDDNGLRVILAPYDEGGNAKLTEAGLNVFTRMRSGDFMVQENPVLYDFFKQYETPGYIDVIVPTTEVAAQYLPDMRTYTLDTFIQIITGEQNIDYFDEFTGMLLNDLGGQQVLDSINELQ